MNDGKGKGRARSLEDSGQPPSDNQSSHISRSILERVITSATGLAHSAVAAPNSNELSEAAAAAQTSSGKGGEIGGSSGSRVESAAANQQVGFATSQRQSLPSIRSDHREEHVRDSEAEFSLFLDGIDSFTPASEPYNEANLPSEQVLEVPMEHVNEKINTTPGQIGHLSYSAVYEQQLHDGDAIVSILSHSSTSIDELESLPLEDAASWDLTDQEISRLRIILDNLLPSPDQHKAVPADHPLNLIPERAMSPVHFDPVLFTDLLPQGSSRHDGENISLNTARRIWIEQWEGVLTRYTDEVWGNLLPLILEAREDFRSIKDGRLGANIEQSKALRRLRLVFDHVRKV